MPEQDEYLQVCIEASIRIKKAFDANDIMLPFSTTKLNFGVKCGMLLKDMSVHVVIG